MRRYWLPLILLLAFLLRVLWLDRYPFGFTPDEASFGYDAYCLFKTGKDQWGKALPLVLESFGDFKPPLYAYLLVPFVGLFGLSHSVVRLPNALLGTAAVYIVFLLVKEILRHASLTQNDNKRKKNESQITKHKTLAALAAFLLAISPWHIMMSRGAFEANLTTFFLPLGIYLFLRALNFNKGAPSRLKGASLNKQKHLSWPSLVFGLNLFSYHSAKLVTPLIVVFLILLYKKELAKVDKKRLLQAVFIFLIFAGLTTYTFTQGAATRAADISVFSGALEAQAQDRLIAIEDGMNSTLARFLHNKYQIALARFWDNYKQYFSYKFLFKDGPGEATYGMIPGRGVLYLIELPFLLAFIAFFVKSLKTGIEPIKNALSLILFWLLISPIPAGLTMGVGYSANRVAIMMPAIQIASVFGALYLWGLFKKKGMKRLVFIGILVCWFIGLFSFVRNYFILSPSKTAQSMLYGNLEASYWLKNNIENQSVLVSRSLSEPHIYIAFANLWEPADYQDNSRDWEEYRGNFKFLDQMGSYSLGNYLFEKIDMEKTAQYKKIVLVGRPDEFSDGMSIIKQFDYPNKEPAIYIVELEGEMYAKNND